MASTKIRLDLTQRGEGRLVPTRSGLNWGQRKVNGKPRNGDEAYINIPAGVGRSNFFPPAGQRFTAWTDDGFTLELVITGKPPKNLHSAGDLTVLGRYFRRRLGVAMGQPVAIAHLNAYGRTYVTFENVPGGFLMDFSRPGSPPPRTSLA